MTKLHIIYSELVPCATGYRGSRKSSNTQLEARGENIQYLLEAMKAMFDRL